MSNSPPQAEHGNNNDHLTTNRLDSMNGAMNGLNSFSSNNNDSSNNNNVKSSHDGLNDNANNSNSVSPSSQTTTSNKNNSTTANNTNSSNNGDDVCRDFLRNVCRRGKSCRYKHPDTNENDAQRKETFVFCHDYQNRECRRENCRFLHCTKQEEEVYRSSGKLPSHLQAQMFPNDDRNNIPVCKDFLNGTCRRPPGRCKFRHPSSDSYQHSMPPNRNGPLFDGRNGGRGGSNYTISPPVNPSFNMDYQQSSYGRQVSSGSNMIPSSNYGYNDGYPEQSNKRKRYDSPMYPNSDGPYSGNYSNNSINNPRGYGGGLQSPSHTPSSSYYSYRNQQQPMESRSLLEEENTALRRRIDELKKQVSELLSTNEYLVEQLRVQNATAPAGVAAVAAATSVASLPPPQQASCSVTSTGVSLSGPPPGLQGVPPSAAAVTIGPLPPSSIVSSIASISLPVVSAPASLVNSSSAATLTSYTSVLHSSTPWPLGVDQ